MIKRSIFKSSAKERCDSIFSKLVTGRGSCVNCGTTDRPRLQAAHIIPRRYSATRTDLANAFCLCFKCHHFYTINPTKFVLFVFSVIGEGAYNELWHKARTITKVDWDAELIRLKKLKNTG